MQIKRFKKFLTQSQISDFGKRTWGVSTQMEEVVFQLGLSIQAQTHTLSSYEYFDEFVGLYFQDEFLNRRIPMTLLQHLFMPDSSPRT